MRGPAASSPEVLLRRFPGQHGGAVRILAKTHTSSNSTSDPWKRTQKVMFECLRHRFGHQIIAENGLQRWRSNARLK